MSRDPAERELLAAANGSAEAFAAFYRRYAEAVLGYFAVRVRDREAAADLMAETFAAALLAVPRYRSRRDGSAPAWLFTIARSKLIDAERRGRVAAEARKRLALGPIDFEDDDLRRVIELADLDQQRSRVVSLIDDLPQDQREALLARFVDDLNYEEIAGSSASAQAAVRKRVSRALGTLRRRWIEDGP